MRYINKEYGFAFRPPYFDKFYEEKTEGPELTDANFPGRYIQGVGYDYSAVNGAMLVGKNGTMWGIKVSYFNGNKWLDNDYFIDNMGSSSANTADGSFAHFASGVLSAKWVRYNEQSIFLQVSARKHLRVRVVFYPCYGLSGELSIEGSVVKGRSPYLGIIPGTLSLTDTNAVYEGRKLVVCDDKPEREYFFAQSYNKPSDSANGAFNEAIMEFIINKNQPSVYVYATVGDETVFTQDLPRKDKMLKQIETAELRYGVNKTMGTGSLCASCERMLNSVLWSRIYYPYLLTELYSPTRALLNKHFDIRGTEENCSAILGSMTCIDKAVYQLSYTLEDKILALTAVWFTFARSVDKDGILPLYQSLEKLYPPEEGLVIAHGAEKTEVAYKWNDSPLKEQSPSEMYSLDMSCLKLLAFDILERMCVLFDLPSRKHYETARKAMIRDINATLWNGDKGIYANRYVMGQWASSCGATSFYPLIAGAVDTPDKLSKLMNSLTDPKRFWTGYLVPTLCADDPEYGKRGRPNNNGERKPPFLEYRGSIVPYVNFIIYQGLARYGLDELAGEIALKSARLWSANESDNVENYSMYLPNGKRYKSRGYLSSNGNMLAMIGVQELIDLEYFRPDLKTHALRFGTFVEGDHSLTNLKLLNHAYSIEIQDNTTILLVDNVPVFRGDGGRFVVRSFLETKYGFEFLIDAHAHITLNLTVQNSKQPTRYFLIAPVGKSRVSAENGMVSVTPIK